MVQVTTMSVYPDTKARLDKHKVRGESYDRVLSKLLDHYEAPRARTSA